LARAGLYVIGGVAVSVALLYGLCASSWGRARICDYVNRHVSAALAGDLRIERLDAIALPTVRAHGVEILAPNGTSAIRVEDVEMELDLAAIVRGTFAWKRALIRAGIVHVLEDERGRVNMAETFKLSELQADVEPGAPGADQLDLRTMVTSDMTLVIGGGSLPKLRLERLRGVMRVHVLPDGRTQLRFDEYTGSIVRGLPSGRLDFHRVKGEVRAPADKLLHFEGEGKSEGEPLAFTLDVVNRPRERVDIEAEFFERSLEAFSTWLVSKWMQLGSGNVQIHVRHRR
jgi:hypothetical protein